MRRGEQPPQYLSYHGRLLFATLYTTKNLGAFEDEKSGDFTVAEGEKVFLSVDKISMAIMGAIAPNSQR